MNKLTDKDTYRPESYTEYKEISNHLFDNGIDVYPELLTIEEDRYVEFPILSWDSNENYLNAFHAYNSDHIKNTRDEFLSKAGVLKIFNGGKHLVHEFI